MKAIFMCTYSCTQYSGFVLVTDSTFEYNSVCVCR